MVAVPAATPEMAPLLFTVALVASLVDQAPPPFPLEKKVVVPLTQMP